ncbi:MULTISPECIES: nucleotide-binding protein [Streptomyces]|uniref:nucleotide-binding protein n=2 Tax=Actinomycetes TaxID=1760 RepID=UPI00087238C7
MAAPLGTQRARTRARLTGETHAQARLNLHGPDGVPDAEHHEQAALEAAILSELHDAYDGAHHPLDGAVYGMTRVRPSRTSLVLHPADGLWEDVLDLLLPATDADLDDPAIAGIPGLRCRPLPKGQIVLYRPDTPASVLLQLPADDVAEARQWITEMSRDGDPVRTTATWTPAEREQLPAYEARLGDVMARSRVLRRLLAFRDLPAVSLIDTSGDVPSPDDFRQILAAGAEERPVNAARTGPVRTLGRPVDRALVLAVVGGHAANGRGRGGVGRTRTTVGLARALAARGLRVLVVDADPAGWVRVSFTGDIAEGVRVEHAVAHGAPDTARLRQLAREPLHDVILLDADPTEQRTIAEAADHWIGVASLWHRPDPWGVLVDETTGANGRPLPSGWDGKWLAVMRANRWMVRWRLAPGDFEGMFAPFPSARCAGVVLLGAREQAGARAQDYLAGLQTVLPVPAPAVPHIPEDDAREQQTISAAFERIVETLFG